MSNAPEEEFDPFKPARRMLSLWWVLVVCAVLGGAAGFVIHRFKPPLYEARAVFMASIDFNKIDFMHPPEPTPVPYKFTQYDEDISLAVVESALIQVKPQVLAFIQQNGLGVDPAGLDEFSSIERKDAYWEVRFRSTDPAPAQKIVNEWARLGFQNLQDKQKAGLLPVYIFFDLIHLADLPTSPIYFQTNSMVLAGLVIGLVIGSLLVNLPVIKK